MTPYLEGNELDKYQSNFSQRRIFIVDFPLKNNFLNTKQEENEIAEFNKQFGAVESGYFRKMPGFNNKIFVLIFKREKSRKEALNYYLTTQASDKGIVIATDIPELKKITNERRSLLEKAKKENKKIQKNSELFKNKASLKKQIVRKTKKEETKGKKNWMKTENTRSINPRTDSFENIDYLDPLFNFNKYDMENNLQIPRYKFSMGYNSWSKIRPEPRFNSGSYERKGRSQSFNLDYIWIVGSSSKRMYIPHTVRIYSSLF